MGLGGLAGLAIVLITVQLGTTEVYFKKKYAAQRVGTAEPSATQQATASTNATCTNTAVDAETTTKAPRVEVLHEDARIFLYHNFLSDEECDHIMKLAAPSLQRSGVVETGSGVQKVDKVRTSKGMFLRRGHDPIIADIEARIAKWTLMPVGNGEGLQVLKYEEGQEYEGHFDYFFHKEGTANGGNRYLTVLMYLNDVEEGGETCFPNIPLEKENGPEFSDCARKVLAAKPKKGNAVLFHSIKPTGELERRSLHTACPVTKGEKWSAPKWVHVGHYAAGGEKPQRIEQVTQTGLNYPDCQDQSSSCKSWASSGECDKNPVFMLGTREKPGNCIKACGKCADFFEFKGASRA
ncbi:putative prolyl 4-hydroxylase 4 [Micractinium conductrix]|uniref:procollagen-proline 4-dioxygenase n=1 Tax=Micractinium conductrix TaxID=554055 RepID=A0A2P6VNB2_9CHLO|nr:putative prolyl 4-hydroxylase 4 [Micractinium conductrix]|eukprot:PSC75580.1 putative prolyl 4-hydroxylase 4 [Micractinium conductrix]